MNTQDFINNAEYLIRQCLNQKNIDPTMEAWLRDACLDLAKAREKYFSTISEGKDFFDDN